MSLGVHLLIALTIFPTGPPLHGSERVESTADDYRPFDKLLGDLPGEMCQLLYCVSNMQRINRIPAYSRLMFVFLGNLQRSMRSLRPDFPFGTLFKPLVGHPYSPDGLVYCVPA